MPQNSAIKQAALDFVQRVRGVINSANARVGIPPIPGSPPESGAYVSPLDQPYSQNTPVSNVDLLNAIVGAQLTTGTQTLADARNAASTAYSGLVTTQAVANQVALMQVDVNNLINYVLNILSLVEVLPDKLFNTLQITGSPQTAGALLLQAGQAALVQNHIGMYQLSVAPLFRIVLDGDLTEFDYELFYDLSAIDPSTQLPGESDYAFLTRVKPLVLWDANLNGSAFVGALQLLGSVNVFYYYMPMQGSPYPVKRLWDYQPSSGPPKRSGVDDSMSIWALIPVQY